MNTAVLTAADVPPGQPYVSPDDLSAITPLWQEASEATLIPIVAQVYQDAAGALHASLVDASETVVPAITSLASEQYLAAARNTFTQVGNDLWETARNQLLEGFQKGESIPELRDRLRQSAGLTGRRATLVARTQVLDASNAGSYDTARASGLDLVKGWEATPDFRTRETHLMAGSTYSGPGMIPMAETFMVGGWPCERPHDPELPPEERYNCRCTLVYQMRHVPVDPHQAYLDDLAAQHQAKLAAIQAQYEGRLAAIQAKHQAKLVKIETLGPPPSMTIQQAMAAHDVRVAEAIAAHEARVAKLTADYEFRRGKLMSDYDYKVAQAKGEIPPPQVPYQLPELPPPAPAVPVPAPSPQPIGAAPVIPAVKPVQIPVRDSLANAKSVQEVRAAFIQEWKNAIATEPGAIRGSARFLTTGDVQTAREHAEGLLRAIERFPMVRIDVTHGPMQPHWAETVGRVISFSDEFAQARDDYLLSLRLAGILDPTGVAWHPMSISSPQGIALHEFGHAFHYSVARDAAGIYDYAAYKRINTEIEQIVRQLATERGITNPSDFTYYEIGGYASTNTTELAAEAFADVMVNGDAASELSRRIVAMLVRKYEAQNGPMPGPPILGLPKLAAKPKPGLDLAAPSEQRFALAVERGVSGDGYVSTGQWGRYGGGGVLPRVETASGPRYLLVQRGPSVDNTGLWQLPGGALDELETVYQAIARETMEELGATESWMGSLTPVAEHVFSDPVSGWKYTSVIARAPKKFVPTVDGTETGAARWFSQAQLEKMLADGKIVPGLESTLQDLIGGYTKFTKGPGVIVDDGLEKLTVAALKDLANARNIKNLVIPKMSKSELVQLIRLHAEAEQRLANAIAEAIDLIERTKDVKGYAAAVTQARKLLKDYPGGELAYAKAQSAASYGANSLLAALRKLAEQRGLRLPVGDELKAVRAARLKTAKEAAAAVRAEKAAATAIQRQVKAVERGDFSSLVRVGPQAGSNPGGVFVDASGQRWYVKESTEQWAREQQLSAALYNLALRDAAHKDWFATPPIVVGQGTPGLSRWQVATRIIEADRDLADKLDDAAYLAQVREGFAVDAWLANWDVAGATFDNVVTYGGRPIRIDVGGTLRFRAQGGAKGSAFGDDVLEWETLRDPLKSPTGSRLFADMTDGELRKAVEKLKAITPARIQALVRSHGLDEKLAARLIARRQYILDRALTELEIDRNFREQLRVALRGSKALSSAPVRLEVRNYRGNVHGIGDPQGKIGRALYEYRGSSSGRINNPLRTNSSPSHEAKGWIARIDEALDQSALPEPVYAFRGLGTGRSIFGQDRSRWGDLTGFEWREPGYGSMSTSLAVAKRFALGYTHPGVILNVLAPRGTLAVQVSGSSYESELLLDRDLIWRVVRDRGDGKDGRRYLDVEIIGRVGSRRLVT